MKHHRTDTISLQPNKSLSEVVALCGRYPEEAFHFLREGLTYSANRLHGALSPTAQLVHRYLAEQNLDMHEFAELFHRDQLPEGVAQAVREAGGCEMLNRHISGQDLCWGLRDYAQHRWGSLAQLVLGRWRIESTLDFGKIVFILVENDLLQKEPNDTLEDFRDVFDFDEALSPTILMMEDDDPADSGQDDAPS